MKNVQDMKTFNIKASKQGNKSLTFFIKFLCIINYYVESFYAETFEA
jgi:hypothetical protein